jgi:hypothetical protein
MLSFIGAGCMALAMSGGVACYSGQTLYCSDVQNGSFPTCTEWNRRMQAAMEQMKRSGCMSQDGSSSSCAWIGPALPATIP